MVMADIGKGVDDATKPSLRTDDETEDEGCKILKKVGCKEVCEMGSIQQDVVLVDKEEDARRATKRPLERKLDVAEEAGLCSSEQDVLADKEEGARAVTKRPIEENAGADGKGMKMMKKMGFTEGGGLGSSQQGIKVPIELQTRSSRLGLGAELVVPSTDLRESQIEIREVSTFFPPCPHGMPDANELKDSIIVGKMPTVIDNETQFCNADVLLAMVKAKNIFDTMDDRQLRNARSRANPFESIRGGIFQNRAAMKMANLDAVFQMQLTEPTDSEGKNRLIPVDLENEQLFYFADICAGPGGFTEYVLWKRKWKARGFGMTLKGRDDFRLDKFTAASPYTFEPYYGPRNNGDITDAENLNSFEKMVMDGTDGVGVHLVMADGGFSVEGRENIQEILSKRLYLCQSLCALTILRPGGNFVCKLFDTFTAFTVGLLNLLWRCFERIAIHKPHTSRPANSERYIVCLGFKGECSVIREHLFNANDIFSKCKRGLLSENEWDDIVALIPEEMLLADQSFCDHVRMRNEQLAMRQTKYLKMYEEFAKNPMYVDDRQVEFRKECLQYWSIPDSPRQPHHWTKRWSAENFLIRYKLKDVRENPVLKPIALDDLKKDGGAKHYVQFICSANEQTHSDIWWMMSNARNETLCLDPKFWRRFQESNFLTENSVILANVTNRRHCDARNRRGRTTIRILDVMLLGGTRFAHLPLESRLKVARTYCKAVSKVKDESRCCLEVAELWEVEKVAEFLRTAPNSTVKVHNCWKLKLQEGLADNYFYACEKLLLLPKDFCGPAYNDGVGDGTTTTTTNLGVPHYQGRFVALPTGINVSSDEVNASCQSIANALCPDS